MWDLNRPHGRLLAGGIVKRSSPAQMQRTVPVRTLGGTKSIDHGLGPHRGTVPGCGTFRGHDGTVWGAGTMSPTRADGTRQRSVAVDLTRWNKADSSGKVQHHRIDDALTALYREAVRGSGRPQVEIADQGPASDRQRKSAHSGAPQSRPEGQPYLEPAG
ncbi:hypothetical protein PUR34_03170 [Streptomyces sp. JV185]|uniref:hypothetical protein n=1 Tax=Streptomyces sp. JV185 TaxID=858638 RepID=UPI002E75A066|nr:hypothetical protein [Streptomyces sp. JV185]MEE1767202.1 hypothetical protein [Streptomyces sp. JV185]